jgi:hypothetical protein
MLVAAGLASLLISPAIAQPANVPAKPGSTGPSFPYRSRRLTQRASLYYSMVWGVDSLSVKSVESGEIIRFAYRVVDPGKAGMLNDRNIEPSLVDPAAGVSLVIPALEKVGKLRQSNTPEQGRSYWMAFSNRGRHVKPGDRITISIGPFRAEGLIVE